MIKNDNITLYAIRGLPGSGKTSFAKSLNLNFYEADQYFEKFNNSKFDHKLLKMAHKYCYESVKQELERGNSTIVSNTMTSKEELKEYEDLAQKLKKDSIDLVEDEGFYEYFDPSYKSDKSKKRACGSNNFSWTAALYLDFCKRKI